jgi:hypothetical protein
VSGQGRGQEPSPSLGEWLKAVLLLFPQAGFLITNSLRFMFSAPGVTSWQYTLLQLQARMAHSSLLCFFLSCGL